MTRMTILGLMGTCAFLLAGCSSGGAKGSLGDSCTRTGDCRTGLRCANGACVLPKLGDPCLDDKDCGDLTCDKKTHVCVGKPAGDGGMPDGPLKKDGLWPLDKPPFAPDKPPTPADLGDPTTCPSWAHGYVFNRIIVPTDSTQSANYALEHNGKLYNSLGGILALISSQAPSMSLQVVIDEAVCSGAALHLLCLRAKSLSSDPTASAMIWPGTAPCCSSAPCAYGSGQCNSTATSSCFSGSNTLSPLKTYKSEIMPGSVSGGQMQMGPGKAVLFLSLAGGQPMAIPLKGAKIKGNLSGGKINDGVLAGGVDKNVLNQTVVPALAASINATYTSYATDQKTKDLLKTLFDTNKDGQITAAEVQGNGLIKTFLDGDVDLDGDNIKELSVGVGFTAVGAKLKL